MQTASRVSICIPLALCSGVSGKNRGVFRTMTNGRPKAVGTQRKDPLNQLWEILHDLAPSTTPSSPHNLL